MAVACPKYKAGAGRSQLCEETGLRLSFSETHPKPAIETCFSGEPGGRCGRFVVGPLEILCPSLGCSLDSEDPGKEKNKACRGRGAGELDLNPRKGEMKEGCGLGQACGTCFPAV